MQMRIRLFSYKRGVFLPGKLGAIWVGVCFQKFFIPFILLLLLPLLLCNMVFYGNIVNTRSKGNIEKQNRLKRCGVGRVLRKKIVKQSVPIRLAEQLHAVFRVLGKMDRNIES